MRTFSIFKPARLVRSFAVWSFAVAALANAEPAPLVEARRALDESIPQVAVSKLRVFLTAPDISAANRRAATLALAEALLDAGQHADALTALRPLSTAGDADARLIQATTLASAGRWEEALALFCELGADPHAPAAAKLGEAESLQALGLTAEAIAVLAPCVAANPANITARLRLANLYVEARRLSKARSALAAIAPQSPADQKWKQYIEARRLLAAGQSAPANAIFEELARAPEGLPESLLAAAALGMSEARIVLKGYEEADTPLETFIARNSESPYLELVFRRLDEIYANQRNPTESELLKWARKPQLRRAALARYYVARLQQRLKKFDKAANTLATFLVSFPESPLLPAVHLMLADLAMQRRDFPAAVRSLEAAQRRATGDEQRAEIELRMGLAQYQQGEHLLAAQSFRNASQRAPKLREHATFDAGLAALGQRNYERFLEDYRELTAHFSDSPLRSELLLEEGLTQARTTDPRATETLELFLLRFPAHERVPEARLALAELSFFAGEGAVASRYLHAVNAASPAVGDHAAYLAIFLEDAKQPRNDEAVIALGQRFLRENPGSILVSDVRMKLGQIYFRRDDFANAETQFATLAYDAPQSPYVETALFLAGESAVRQINPGAVDRALLLFDDVAKLDGALKLYARQQQAIVQSRLGRDSEAIALYDVILATQPAAEPELRFAALCGKGDNLVALGRTDAARIDAAIAVFDQLAALAGVTPVWRNQALYKKAKALEQLGRVPEALVTFYDVLDRSGGPESEYFWFYKSGFDAARIFEGQSQWKSAIGIYEKMAKPDGPRSAEARARVKQLRLEKFIWE